MIVCNNVIVLLMNGDQFVIFILSSQTVTQLTNIHSCSVQVPTDVTGHCRQFTDITEHSNKH